MKCTTERASNPKTLYVKHLLVVAELIIVRFGQQLACCCHEDWTSANMAACDACQRTTTTELPRGENDVTEMYEKCFTLSDNGWDQVDMSISCWQTG
jgi:hypothetical protein